MCAFFFYLILRCGLRPSYLDMVVVEFSLVRYSNPITWVKKITKIVLLFIYIFLNIR